MRFVLNPELTMHVGNIIMFVQRLAKFILSLQETKDFHIYITQRLWLDK